MKMSPSEARNHAGRHNRIEVKVSDEELDLIRKRAEKVNLNVSAYMRRMATVGEIKLFDLSELYGLRSAIDIFGSNVNQIAKVANSILKFDGDKLIGLEEQLTKAKTDKAFLFGESPAATPMKAELGTQHREPAPEASAAGG
ncbi:MAG: plasmid mobilization protein [Huintestinicola sp.]